MTQTVLSAMTGIPQPHMSEMERGNRPIGEKIAGRLAKALEVDYRVFLYRVDPGHRSGDRTQAKHRSWAI